MANQRPPGGVGQLAPVADKETAHAGELIRLPRQHPHDQLFTGEVRAGEFERFGAVCLVDLHRSGLRLGAARFQLLQAVRAADLVFTRFGLS